MLTFASFLFGLAILIGVHEYGHYRMAVACGVRVIRFAIGMGPVVWGWTSPVTRTEYVLCAVPLGGYVRMLDEREAPVDPAERAQAFNTQVLWRRTLIVAAGPFANFLLAIALYAGVFWSGLPELSPVLASPMASSMAQEAGLKGGERVLAVRELTGDPVAIDSMEALRWHLTRFAIQKNDVEMDVLAAADSTRQITVVLPLSRLDLSAGTADPMALIGIAGPWTEPVLGDIVDNSPAQRALLKKGDVVLKVDDVPVVDGQQLRGVIRAGVTPLGTGVTQRWHIRRNGHLLALDVTTSPERVNDRWAGRIGAYIGTPPERVVVRKEPLDAVLAAAVKTYDVSMLSLNMLGKMITGEASLRNLSGPLTIADYAGKSASLGITPYLLFLALISVSLGVLNLLPLPMLDGGHLMYYLYEGVTGRSVPETWQDRFQRGGVVILMGMMFIALFNDVARILG
ncbi:MAG: RIP metalloprotease RseP [Burkholderiales bacterium]|nr:RIP metalloprotease RseP [Burkholderiales bacterium]